MSKPVTAVATMILVQEGKLKVTDKLKQYFPEFSNMRVYVSGDRNNMVTEPANRDITIHDLLTHTSGLSYGPAFFFSPVDAEYPVGRIALRGSEYFISEISKIPLRYQPGSRWHYSLSHDVLSLVIEKVSGIAFAEFCDQRIFKPMGMVDTGFYVPREKMDRFANSYREGTGGQLTVGEPHRASYMSYRLPPMVSGGGGLVSTPTEFLRFGQMLLNGGSWEGVEILKPETLDMMWTNQLLPHQLPFTIDKMTSSRYTTFGYGWSITSHWPVDEQDWSKVSWRVGFQMILFPVYLEISLI